MPSSAPERPDEEEGAAARLWRILTLPRGNRLWDGVVRGSGLLGLLGIALVELVPETAPLVGFSIFTIWMTGPLSPLFPTGYEPVLMVMSRVYAPLLVAAVGMATQIYVEFLNYHLHRRLLSLDAARSLRESSVVQKLQGWFEQYPFFTVWFCAWSPVPYWTVRVLAPLSGYPLGRYMAATVLGRFPKLWIFAALGLYWRTPSDALLLGVAGGSMVLGVALWVYRRFRDEADRSTPAAWSSPVVGGSGTAAPPSEPASEPVGPAQVGSTVPPAQVTRTRVKVLYIGGIGRSGSTLLARALGEADGLVAAGEVMHFFGRGLVNDERCACRRAVRDCPLWGRVAERLREREGPLASSRVEDLRQRITEGPHLPTLFSPLRPPGFEEKIRRYRHLLSLLYTELRRAAGAEAIVDSSKNAGYARILSDTPGVELHLVHLIRDPRGVAHSLRKRKERPGVPDDDGRELLDRRGPGTASLFWSAAQAMTEALRSGATTYRRVRYRDFVRFPAVTLRSVLRGTGAYRGDGQLEHVDRRSLDLRRQHLLSGNPVREKNGIIPLEEDLEWRRELSPGARGLVTAVTLPLLHRYGYLSSSDGDGGGPGGPGADRGIP